MLLVKLTERDQASNQNECVDVESAADTAFCEISAYVTLGARLVYPPLRPTADSYTAMDRFMILAYVSSSSGWV